MTDEINTDFSHHLTDNSSNINEKDKFKTYRLKDSPFINQLKPNHNKESKSIGIQRDCKNRRATPPKIIKNVNNQLINEKEENIQICQSKSSQNLSNRINRFNSTIIKVKNEEKGKYSTIVGFNSLKNDFSSIGESIDLNEVELGNISQSELPVIVSTNTDDYNSTTKIENNKLTYFQSKRKPFSEFSCEFLQSFTNKTSIINENVTVIHDSVNNKIKTENNSNNDKSPFIYVKEDLKNVITKNPRTKSLIVVKKEKFNSEIYKKGQSFSLNTSSKSEKEYSQFLDFINKDNYGKQKLNLTFTKYSYPSFQKEINNNKVLQRLHDIKTLKTDNTTTIPRHRSDYISSRNRKETFTIYKIKSKSIESKNSRKHIELTEKDVDETVKNVKENLSNLVDELPMIEEGLSEIDINLQDITNKDSREIQTFSETDYLCNIERNIDHRSLIKQASILNSKNVLKKTSYDDINLTEVVSNNSKIKKKKTKIELEQPKKHIYAELLLFLIPEIINDIINSIEKLKSGNYKRRKESSEKMKIGENDTKEITETVDDIIKLVIDEEFFRIDIKQEISGSLDIISKLGKEFNEEEVNNNILLEDSIITKENKFNSKHYSKNSDVFEMKHNLRNMKKTIHSSKYRLDDSISCGNDERVKFSWNDEASIPEQVKQTILMYDAQMRKLTKDNNSLLEENLMVIELNKSLQKRNGVLLTEFKQEKRETAFIKNQISVMISRMQSIPEKLSQLETENVNLKAEISDLERTLDQRDQLFTSERHMNASLSEEIIKLESDSVNKELMKNVCEEFENLNEEYENLKKNLEETEDKLFEIVQDRDNLIKHANIMEEHLYKLKTENNYLVQNYQMMSVGGIIDPRNNIWNTDNKESMNCGQSGNMKTMSNESNKVEVKDEERKFRNYHRCGHSKHRSHSRSVHYVTSSDSSLSSSSSTYYSSSSRDSKRRHKKKRNHSHKHKHKKSHSHKSSHKKRRSRKDDTEEMEKPETVNKNQNANAEESSSQFIIEMPKSREELKKLEDYYDTLQRKKEKMSTALSHIPTNKGVSNSSNLTNMQEQETLERDLDQCDKQLASLRKILKECKVFRSIP